MIQKNIIIIPETFVRFFGSTPDRTVVAWIIIVNIIIETDSEAIMIYGFDLLSHDPALAQSITGRSGRTQGASIVSIPAKNEIIKRVIK